MTEDGKVHDCREKDLNCLLCEDKTGICLKCKEGNLENGVCKTRPELEGAAKSVMNVAKGAMTTASLAVMSVNTSGGIRVVKIIKIFDYLGFVDIEKPKNLDAIF